MGCAETLASIFMSVVILGVIVLVIAARSDTKKKIRLAAEAQAQVEASRRAAEESRLRHNRQEQQRYATEMIALGDSSLNLFETMPTNLSAAEQCLDQAELDFADGAFAPFWDCIERATKELGQFDESAQQIKNNASQYTQLVPKYERTPPRFPLASRAIQKLNVAQATAARLKEIVRAAQRDFQFATIYEQRKTNQILIAGFTSLAHALDRMTSQITASIDDLIGSIDAMHSTLNKSLDAIQLRMERITTRADQHHQDTMAQSSEAAARQERALEMLDNIQRRRRPG